MNFFNYKTPFLSVIAVALLFSTACTTVENKKPSKVYKKENSTKQFEKKPLNKPANKPVKKVAEKPLLKKPMAEKLEKEGRKPRA